MVLCSCGQFTEDGTTQCSRCEALQVLGLGVAALEPEIRSAYRLLSKAWQPKNFQDDPKLKESAEAKLQDIQTAFEFLTMTSSYRSLRQRPVYLSAKLAAVASVPVPVSDAQAFLGANSAPAPIPGAPHTSAAPPKDAPPQLPQLAHQTPSNPWQRFKIPIIVAAAILVLASLLLIWTASSAPEPSADQAASVNGSGARKKPVNPLVELLARALNAIDPQPAVPPPQSAPLGAQSSTPEANPPAAPPPPPDARNPQPAKSPGAIHQAQPRALRQTHLQGIKLTPYVTIGSTREEVLAQQGPPTASTENKLVYGGSELYLKNNAVVGWRINRATSPLHVKLWPRTPVDSELQFFSVGSTKDEVLKVQGTPTAFSDDQFEYDRSIVYFSNNRVVRWKSDPASVVLWAR
jgi:hypothetical protein